MTTLEQLVSSANFDHSRNVAKISRIIALQAGYSTDEADIVEQAALYHDIGKTAIPPAILNKPGKLTAEEFEIVKRHTTIGYEQIMEVIMVLGIAATVAKEHHERLDGSGYLKLLNNDINPYARLISVADVFDALISRRAYKEPWNITCITKYLAEQKNSFDSYIVQCLINALNEILLVYKTDEL